MAIGSSNSYYWYYAYRKAYVCLLAIYVAFN